MGATYTIDTDRRRVYCCAWGILTDAEVWEHYLAIQADPNFAPDFDQLADLSEVCEVSISADTLRVVGRLQVFDPDSRRAFIAPTDLLYGMARMFEAYVEIHGGQLRVFRDAGEAEDWLTEGGGAD